MTVKTRMSRFHIHDDESAPAGSVLLAMLPDTGERYLSTMLFDGIAEGSDDEWLASVERETEPA